VKKKERNKNLNKSEERSGFEMYSENCCRPGPTRPVFRKMAVVRDGRGQAESKKRRKGPERNAGGGGGKGGGCR